MADTFYASIILQNDLINFLKNKGKMKILNDSEKLVNVAIMNASTRDRRLMVDIKAARDAYNEGIVNDIIWIRLEYNLSDAMTKHKILPQLFDLLQTGKIKSEIEKSVFC